MYSVSDNRNVPPRTPFSEEHSRIAFGDNFRSAPGNPPKNPEKKLCDTDRRVQHHYSDHKDDPPPAHLHDEEMLGHGRCFTMSRSGLGGAGLSFTIKLHEMLNSAEEEDLKEIVSWQPHGRCFVIRDVESFKELLPRFFGIDKIASFQRQLNMYGFQRITQGRDRCGYYHELFLRGRVFLAYQIRRIRIKGNGARAKANPDQEPDFWNMPWLEEVAQLKSPERKQSLALPLPKASPRKDPPAIEALSLEREDTESKSLRYPSLESVSQEMAISKRDCKESIQGTQHKQTFPNASATSSRDSALDLTSQAETISTRDCQESIHDIHEKIDPNVFASFLSIQPLSRERERATSLPLPLPSYKTDLDHVRDLRDMRESPHSTNDCDLSTVSLPPRMASDNKANCWGKQYYPVHDSCDEAFPPLNLVNSSPHARANKRSASLTIPQSRFQDMRIPCASNEISVSYPPMVVKREILPVPNQPIFDWSQFNWNSETRSEVVSVARLEAEMESPKMAATSESYIHSFPANEGQDMKDAFSFEDLFGNDDW